MLVVIKPHFEECQIRILKACIKLYQAYSNIVTYFWKEHLGNRMTILLLI